MLVSTETFLRHILPTEGYYCATIFRQGSKPYNWFTPSIDALVERILVEDANGNTVYHACASFSTPDNRTSQNARFARCLWLDIDAYPSSTAAINAVAAFARDGFFPPTCVVESGRGIHCYWQFDKNLAAADWRAEAEEFRDLCDRHNLQADHSRTCDLASILRPPGTANRKYGTPIVVRGHL